MRYVASSINRFEKVNVGNLNMEELGEYELGRLLDEYNSPVSTCMFGTLLKHLLIYTGGCWKASNTIRTNRD